MALVHTAGRVTPPVRDRSLVGRRLRLQRRATAALALLLLATLSACATGPRRPPVGTLEPDKFLWERGTAELNEKHWITAREYFRQLMDSYPQSTYRADAKLGLADSYLGDNSLEGSVLAINEYREFLSFYPTHARADYAQFKLGMAHFRQMRAAQRDQTETREAIKEFEAFITRYPNSELMPEVKTKYRESRDRLSESDYLVGYFYFRQRWYPGAIVRLKALLKDDPEYTGRDAVFYHLAEALARTKKEAEALPYFEQLVQEFEQSEYLPLAQKRITELKTRVAVKPTGD